METLTKLPEQNNKNTNQDTSHAPLVHLSSFSSYIGVPFGSILGPLITWSIWKDKSAFVDAHGKEALNFNLSITLYQILAVIVGLFMFLTPILSMAATESENPIGIILSIPGLLIFISGIGLLSIFRIVAIIIATFKASNGEYFNYPLSIKFIK